MRRIVVAFALAASLVVASARAQNADARRARSPSSPDAPGRAERQPRRRPPDDALSAYLSGAAVRRAVRRLHQRGRGRRERAALLRLAAQFRPRQRRDQTPEGAASQLDAADQHLFGRRRRRRRAAVLGSARRRPPGGIARRHRAEGAQAAGLEAVARSRSPRSSARRRSRSWSGSPTRRSRPRRWRSPTPIPRCCIAPIWTPTGASPTLSSTSGCRSARSRSTTPSSPLVPITTSGWRRCASRSRASRSSRPQSLIAMGAKSADGATRIRRREDRSHARAHRRSSTRARATDPIAPEALADFFAEVGAHARPPPISRLAGWFEYNRAELRQGRALVLAGASSARPPKRRRSRRQSRRRPRAVAAEARPRRGCARRSPTPGATSPRRCATTYIGASATLLTRTSPPPHISRKDARRLRRLRRGRAQLRRRAGDRLVSPQSRTSWTMR